MKLSAHQSTLRQMKADAVAILVLEDKRAFGQQMDALKKLAKNQIIAIEELEKFKGKEGTLAYTFTDRKLASPRLLLVGLGASSKLNLEKYRRAAATAAKKAKDLGAKHLAFALPETPSATNISAADVACAIGEGAILSMYKFDKYFTEKRNDTAKLTRISVFDKDDRTVRSIRRSLSATRIICEAVYLARDLANAPGNEIYPESLAAVARTSGETYGYSVTVWDKRRIEKEGFGGLLGVNAGSAKPPVFIQLEYEGVSRKSQSVGQPIVLVGKGITFDTGGISIKPSANMAEMKMDMSGAAAVIATFEAVARLKLPVHIIGLVPATENMPSGSAIKPGDVIRHYGGKTSEVDNTDAEGRLILADALAYADKFKPAAVIDLATLTGACVVALGHHATGMMGNDEKLMEQLRTAGEKTYERVWPLPMFEEYEKQIKSDVADVKNVGGRWAGAITAGLFLKKFVGNYPWVHLDIAGTAILGEDLPYTPKGGSGVGVRLLVEYLASR